MPMVVMKEGVNESSLNRSKQHDLPTPESPIKSSLIYGVEVSLRFLLVIESAGRDVPENRSCASLPSWRRSRMCEEDWRGEFV